MIYTHPSDVSAMILPISSRLGWVVQISLRAQGFCQTPPKGRPRARRCGRVAVAGLGEPPGLCLGTVGFHGALRRPHVWDALRPRREQRRGRRAVHLARPARHAGGLAGRVGGGGAHLQPDGQPVLPAPGSNTGSNTGKRNRTVVGQLHSKCLLLPKDWPDSDGSGHGCRCLPCPPQWAAEERLQPGISQPARRGRRLILAQLCQSWITGQAHLVTVLHHIDHRHRPIVPHAGFICCTTPAADHGCDRRTAQRTS